MKKTFVSLLMVLGLSAAVCAVDVADVAKKAMEQVTPNTITFKGQDGWLYSKNELAHLSAAARSWNTPSPRRRTTPTRSRRWRRSTTN
jgi:hypothetical protein